MSNKVLRSTASMALLCAGGLAVAGCFGPTYGTGVTATDQLFDDLNNAISLGDRTPPPQINYTPRPDIVQPADPNSLPAPQESIATASGQWPESPEERRARVRREADEGLRDPNFIANRTDAEAIGASEGPGRVPASAVRRVYLTDPPAEYRQPAETAAYGDLGATEAEKERAAKRAQGEKTGWRRFLPF